MSDCEHKKAKCIDTRRRVGYRLRRYKCDNCGHKYSSIEVILRGDLRKGPNMNALKSLVLRIKRLSF